MDQPFAGVSVAQLKKATVIKEKIESLERELAVIFGAPGKTAAPAEVSTGPKMPAAVRARMAAARKAWWAKRKACSAPAPVAKPKPKPTMSEAGRRRLSRRAKARWAKAKAAGKTSLKAG